LYQKLNKVKKRHNPASVNKKIVLKYTVLTVVCLILLPLSPLILGLYIAYKLFKGSSNKKNGILLAILTVMVSIILTGVVASRFSTSKKQNSRVEEVELIKTELTANPTISPPPSQTSNPSVQPASTSTVKPTVKYSGTYPTFTLTVPSKNSSGSYICNCSKTCPNLSCAEAQYQLNSCGCTARNADRDGIACDSQCQ